MPPKKKKSKMGSAQKRFIAKAFDPKGLKEDDLRKQLDAMYKMGGKTGTTASQVRGASVEEEKTWAEKGMDAWGRKCPKGSILDGGICRSGSEIEKRKAVRQKMQDQFGKVVPESLLK